MIILGIIGPFQLLFLLFIVAVIVTVVIVVVRLSSKNIPDSTIIDNLHSTQNSSHDKISSLERLSKLRESGVLNEEEFQREKKKILGS